MVETECLVKNVYLADDDEDDRDLFKDALQAVCKNSCLTVAKDGLELMDFLYKPPVPLPDLIFLDLNMPLKNGFECLEEIKSDVHLKQLPVIIFSTTAQPDAVNRVYRNGANFYMCKPDDYGQLKRIIKRVLSMDWKNILDQPSKDNFVLLTA